MKNEPVIILGAGVGGLCVGYFLNAQNQAFNIHEASDNYGGLARSFRWHGVMCDLAPHRLYTQDKVLLNELCDLVDYQVQPRKSLIYLQGQWIDDPVNPLQLIKRMPIKLSYKLMITWLSAKLSSGNAVHSFDDYIVHQFGTELNRLFFKPYAEKLFGMPADKISSEWGKKKVRVSGFKSILKRNSKIYFNQFYYPFSGGYGALVDCLYDIVQGATLLNSKVINIENAGQGSYQVTMKNAAGEISQQQTSSIVSTIPMPKLCKMLGYDLNLQYKSARLFFLHIDKACVMPEHWRYFVESDICVNRISEFKNFSTDHDNPLQTVLCAEVTNEKTNGASVVISDLEKIGLINAENVLDVKEIYLPYAYPIYSLEYTREIAKAEQFLSQFEGLYVVGRQAQFNHMDVDEIFSSAKDIAGKL